jgi:hypothetical protein
LLGGFVPCVALINEGDLNRSAGHFLDPLGQLGDLLTLVFVRCRDR